MRLSKNFILSEFTQSDTAAQNGIANIPGKEEIKAIENLVVNLLQPIREIYNKPMRINSGFRCPELNKAVGGVSTSQHVKGEAADVACDNPQKLKDIIVNSGIDYDQIGIYSGFLHISLKLSGANRKNIFKGKY